MIEGFQELLHLLDSRGVRYRRNLSDPDEYAICCPFCFETRFRFGFNTRKNKYHCFNCDTGSNDALTDLAEVLDLGVLSGKDANTPSVEERRVSGPPSLPDDFMFLTDPHSDTLFLRARSYLLNRGVSYGQIKEKKIGVSFVGRYAYRIIFPVYYGKTLKGLVARDCTGKQEPKYLNSVGMKAIYNLPKNRNKKAVLCEGVFDCLALERSLPENYDVLALLGHSMTEEQEHRLDPYESIILWPDADLVGLLGFFSVGKQLALHHNVWVVPPSRIVKDAADMTPAMREDLWIQRAPLTESLELRLRVGVSLND
jgi:DNA primase